MGLEMLFGDVHDDFAVYDAVGSRLDALAKDGKKPRLYCLGDFSEGINQKVIAQQTNALRKNPQVIAILKQAEAASKVIQTYSKRDNATLTAADKTAIEEAHAAIEQAQSIDDAIYAKEAEERYAEHEKRLSMLKKKHGVAIYGIAGNHDNVFVYNNLRSIDLLETTQSLSKEGVVGAIHSTEIWPAFAGPGVRYSVPRDDHDDPAQSPLYTGLKDSKVDLVVVHKEANHPGDKMPSGQGLLKLVNEKKCVQYSGHWHNAYVRKDPTTGTLVICPGQDYVMVCDREGNKVKKIDIYRIPTAGRAKMHGYTMAA